MTNFTKTDKGANASAILRSLYVSISTFSWRVFGKFLISIDWSSIITSVLNLEISFFNATSLSVSLIFKVFSPVYFVWMDKPRLVTIIVCARSGFSIRSNSINFFILCDFDLSNIISSFLKYVLTPKFS